MISAQTPRTAVRWILNAVYLVVVLLVIAGIFFPSISPDGRNHFAAKTALMQTSRGIELCLFQYAADHNGHHPEGKSSTEVFQKLIDGGYLANTDALYSPWQNMPGKVCAQNNQLKPENVCWDITCCVDSSTPDDLPMVFLTGYKITYQADAPAMPRVPIVPIPPRTWSQFLSGTDVARNYIVVSCKDHSARVMEADNNGNIPNFISADFDPKGKVYRQLTPEGELTP